jgi:EmrB/QacA subfamily drug resistance transporter
MATAALDLQESRKHRLRWWTLGVLCLSALVVVIDSSILNVALPTLQRELGASAAGLQWIVTSYILIFGGMLLTTGSLGDRFGRAMMLRAGLVVFALASLSAAYTGTTGQLIAARAVMGLGAAMIVPSTLSIAVDVFKGEERTKAIAFWAALNAVGIVLGPIIGGLILEHLDWSWIFLVNIPIAATAILFTFLLITESRDAEAKPLDIPGAILSMVAVSSLVYAIIQGPDEGWTSRYVLVCFAVAAVTGVGFILREMRARYPLLDLSFFKKRRFTAGATALSLQSLALAGLMFAFTLYLQFVQGYSPLEAGIRFLPLAVGLMVGARMSERLVHYFGTTRVIAGGLLLMAVTLPLIILWQADSPYWLIGVVLLAVGFGVGNVAAPSVDAIMGAVPEAKAGVASATNSVIRMIGGALGIAILGSIISSLYAGKVASAVASLPVEHAALAKNNVGAAMTIAASLPGEAGWALSSAAGNAFTDAMGEVAIISAVVMAVTAVLVLVFMPSRAENGVETPRKPEDKP